MTTLTRERLDVQPEVSQRPQRQKKVASTPTFTVLPKAFCASPGRHRLSVYETGVLCALIAMARQSTSLERKVIAEGEKARIFTRGLRKGSMAAAQSNGNEAFHSSMAEQKREGHADVVKFVARPLELLRMAGLDTGTRALRKFKDALTQLQQSRSKLLGPPLIDYEVLETGQYRFEVSGRWLEGKCRTVFLPLPSTSIRGLNLYLYMRTQWGKPVTPGEVCKAIGLNTGEQRRHIVRAFKVAKASYVQHARTTGKTSRSKMPVSFSLKWIGEDDVRFKPSYPDLD